MEFDEERDGDEEEEEEEEDIGILAKMASGETGALMVHHHHHHRKPPLNRYRECLKNHAVGIGGNAVDGCCEFMPGGDDGTLDALKCAACNCHRNFHRKETDGDATCHSHPYSHHYPSSAYRSAPSGYLTVAPHHHYRPPLALPSISGGAGAGAGAGHSRDDQEEDMSNPSGSASRKRFRTKFTQEQKDKMLSFAEKVGWRIQKQDEAAVQQFCTETCVKRHVLKVWMHNNKHTLGKKPLT